MWQYSLITVSYPRAMDGCSPDKSIAIFISNIKHVYFLFVINVSLLLFKLMSMEKADIATDLLE